MKPSLLIWIRWITPRRWFWLLLARLVPIHLAVPDRRKGRVRRCAC